MKLTELPETLHDMLNLRAWDHFMGGRLGNDLFINDPERASRIYDASESGGDGSTHAECIQDQRDFAEILRDESLRECETDDEENAVKTWHDKISSLLDEVETFHEGNGSLHEEIG